MTLLAEILARIAYEDTVKAIKERNPDYIPPKFEDVRGNADVAEFTEVCAGSLREYLENKYSK
jgi:hypothetical protein